MFYLGQNEDCSPESAPQVALRNFSEEVWGKDSIYAVFSEGGIHAVKNIFVHEVSTSLLKPSLVTWNSHHHEGF